MSLDKHKYRQLLLDVFIVILILVVLILVDFFYVSYKSGSGELNNEIWQKQTEEILNQEPLAASSPAIQTPVNGQMVFAPILNFHRIDKAPKSADKISRSYFVEPAKFEQTLKDLLAAGYEFYFVSEVINFLQTNAWPEHKFVAITFDDGNEDFYTNAWPLLQKYQVKSSIYIMSGVRGDNYLSQEQIKELSETDLVEVGSHTVWHPYLTKITSQEIESELSKSKTDLEILIGKDVTILCYPFGLYNDEVKEIAKSVGYVAGLTFDQDAWQNSGDLFSIRRISVYPELNALKYLERLKTEN